MVGLTRWVNRLFKSCTSGPEMYEYGVYHPMPKVRRPSSFSSSSTSMSSISSSSNTMKREMKENARQKAEEERLAEEARIQAKKEMEKKAKEYDEKFKKHSGGKSTMTLAQAAQFGRTLGFAPTASDLMNYHTLNPGDITLERFMTMMADIGSVHETEEDLVVLFRHYDKLNRGVISKNQLINILTSFGEPLTLEECNTLLKDLGLDTDPVDYMKLVRALMTP